MIVSEIRYNQAIERLRFDAEHYQPEFLKLEGLLKKCNSVFLSIESWLTLEQIAEYLQMSTASIYKMSQAGKIPVCKVGRQWNF